MALNTEDSILKFCRVYALCQAGAPISRNLKQARTELESSFREHPVIKAENLLLIEASVGSARVAEVPWLAIMDPRETGTVQRGAFVILLFRHDMSGVYLCFGCGVEEFKTRADGISQKNELITKLQEFGGELTQIGFSLSNDIDLRTQSADSLDSIRAGIAAYKFYACGSLPVADEFFPDLSATIAAYRSYVNAKLNLETSSPGDLGQETTAESRTAWLFQVDPSIYDIDSALRVLPAIECLVSNHADEIAAGDIGYLCKGGAERCELLASGKILAEAEVRLPLKSDIMFYRNGDYARNTASRVSLELEKILDRPLGTSDFVSVPILRDLIARQAYGRNLRMSSAEHQAIEAVLRGDIPPAEPSPIPILDAVSIVRAGDYVEPQFEQILASIKGDGLKLDDRLIRRYHLALHSRGFVILAGMSGTGKTWLTKAYADAVGATYELVCVAPNWNSNEHLLGEVSPFKKNEYLDTSFSYFLRQASDAYLNAKEVGLRPKPFHVVLDEMNLARVEYYFALFLSKMEERAREGVATLRLGRDEVLLTPNLYFVGTVNVDETTHGFSDKVFDRAQLIELEPTENLIEEHIGDKPFHEMLMTIWRIIHNVAPFSFRVIDDIMAYVAHAEAISASWDEAFDEQITQKILPKVKGKDAGTEAALRQLADYCEGKLPFTHRKIQTMLSTRDRNGDISFFTG